MKLIMNLNDSVKLLGQRFESFQTNIEEKVNKMSAEFMLLKNKVGFIEKNCMPQSFSSMSSPTYEYSQST